MSKNKKLEAAGVDRKQAEAHAAAVRDMLASQVATEASLQAVAHGLDNRITGLDHRIDKLDVRLNAVAADVADMKPRLRRVETELRVLRWMVGTNLAGTFGLIGLLLRRLI